MNDKTFPKAKKENTKIKSFCSFVWHRISSWLLPFHLAAHMDISWPKKAKKKEETEDECNIKQNNLLAIDNKVHTMFSQSHLYSPTPFAAAFCFFFFFVT